MVQHAASFKKFRVCAIVVSYFPDVVLLQRVIEASLPQVDNLVIVDNTPGDGAGLAFAEQPGALVTVLRQGRNIGVAAALNVGVQFARSTLATHYLFLDQDSLPAPDMVTNLCLAWSEATGNRIQVAAVGPAFSDERGGAPPPFIKVHFPCNQIVHPTAGISFVRTNVLITSGSLVSEDALASIGLMNEWLFIDNVDIEWGFRAQALGWHLIGAPQARLSHRIGDDHLVAPTWARWFFRRKIAVRHSDFRLYYIFRNRVALYRLATIPYLWKLQDLIRLPFKIALCLSISPKPGYTGKRLFTGMRDGLIGQQTTQKALWQKKQDPL